VTVPAADRAQNAAIIRTTTPKIEWVMGLVGRQLPQPQWNDLKQLAADPTINDWTDGSLALGQVRGAITQAQTVLRQAGQKIPDIWESSAATEAGRSLSQVDQRLRTLSALCDDADKAGKALDTLTTRLNGQTAELMVAALALVAASIISIAGGPDGVIVMAAICAGIALAMLVNLDRMSVKQKDLDQALAACQAGADELQVGPNS